MKYHILFILSVLCCMAMPAKAALDVDLIDRDRYTHAREAHLKGQWDAAITRYDTIEDANLKTLCDLHAAECHWRTGDQAAALKRLDHLLVAKDLDTETLQYMLLGEAHLLRAWIRLHEDDSPQSLASVIKDTQAIQQWADELSDIAIAEPQTPGQLHPAFVNHHDLILPDNTAWYVPMILEQARILEAYTLLELQRYEAAEAILDRMLHDVCPWSTFSAQYLDQLNDRFAEGAIVLPKSARDLLQEVDGRKLKLGFLMIAMHRFDLAEPVFRDVHARNVEGKGPADIWAASEIGLAACSLAQGELNAAKNRLRLFDGLLRASRFSEHGRLLLANMLARDEESYTSALRIYSELENAKHDDVAKQALHCMLLAGQDHDNQEIVEHAKSQLESMKSLQSKRRTKQPTDVLDEAELTLPAVDSIKLVKHVERPIWLPQAPVR